MAVALEFINVIVPIDTIRRKYPGGWEQCLADYANALGGRVWHDEHLFRDGAMNPADAEWIVEQWKELGFEPNETVDGELRWKDLCVVEGMFGGVTLPCDWIEVDRRGWSAWLAGTEPAAVAGPSKDRRD